MNVKQIVGYAIFALTLAQKYFTKTTIDDKSLAVLRAIEADPALLMALQAFFESDPQLPPPGALPVLEGDSPLVVACNNNACLVQMAKEDAGVPDNAEAIGLGGIMAAWQAIQLLYELWKAWKAGTIGKME